MSATDTESSSQLPPPPGRVFFQAAPTGGCAATAPDRRDDSVQKKQGKVTVKYDRKELRKRLILEEWIIEQLSELYDCEVTLVFSRFLLQ
ncbi:PP14B phosphatase, partial [Amia calva]|nr:PP14B phosphatase [Amia calva]